MDSTTQWTQEFGMTRSMAEIASPIISPCTRPAAALMEKKVMMMRPPKLDQVLNCPRCHSTNTKFCYYNNYSLTQPRYFCKTCRRYWTDGGTLRNVPVGGGSRKHNKKKSISNPNNNNNNNNNSPSLSMPMDDQLPISSQRLVQFPDLMNPPSNNISHQNPKIHYQGQDLNLGFQTSHDYHHGVSQFPNVVGKNVISASTSSSSIPLSALNFLRNGNIAARQGLNSIILPNMAPSSSTLGQTNNALFERGFPFQECKPSLAFSIDGNNINGSGYVNSNVPEENMNGTLMFTLGGTKRHSSTSEGGDQQDKGSHENNSNGFWNGMLGGGSW